VRHVGRSAFISRRQTQSGDKSAGLKPGATTNPSGGMPPVVNGERSTELRTWATRLVTPGGKVEDAGVKTGATTALRKVPQRIDRRQSAARWQSRRETCGTPKMHATLGKGEKVG